MGQNKFAIGLFLFVLMIVPGMAQAHSADTFTVVIKQSGLTRVVHKLLTMIL